MHDYLIEWLQCPHCGGELAWRVMGRSKGRVESGEATCRQCAAVYPVQEGIGLFLTPELPRQDLWAQVESGLAAHLRTQPDVEQQLMGGVLEELGPADQFFRAMLLEERGAFAEAKAAHTRAFQDLYTADYLAGMESAFAYLAAQVGNGNEPVVDLASGRGYLLERLAQEVERPLVGSDFSPRVLRQDRRRLEHFGLYDRVSLLAFDARRPPFKDGVVPVLTTFVGLANIEAPGDLLRRLRRMVGGRFLAIHTFVDERDETNRAALRELKLEEMAVEGQALALFGEAGWQVTVANRRPALARPTPRSVILDGAGIDAFPVAETTIEWCVLDAV
jgi:uncharacterized protein YbaR (Trm112 family)